MQRGDYVWHIGGSSNDYITRWKISEDEESFDDGVNSPVRSQLSRKAREQVAKASETPSKKASKGKISHEDDFVPSVRSRSSRKATISLAKTVRTAPSVHTSSEDEATSVPDPSLGRSFQSSRSQSIWTHLEHDGLIDHHEQCEISRVISSNISYIYFFIILLLDS